MQTLVSPKYAIEQAKSPYPVSDSSQVIHSKIDRNLASIEEILMSKAPNLVNLATEIGELVIRLKKKSTQEGYSDGWDVGYEEGQQQGIMSGKLQQVMQSSKDNIKMAAEHGKDPKKDLVEPIISAFSKLKSKVDNPETIEFIDSLLQMVMKSSTQIVSENFKKGYEWGYNQGMDAGVSMALLKKQEMPIAR